MSPEMQALYQHCISNPQLHAMFRQKATENAASMIDDLFVNESGQVSSSRLSDEQIAALPKPKSFSEIRETLQAILRGGREETVGDLAKLSVFSRVKKSVRREFIRQNLYKMERDGQTERAGSQGRSIMWRLS